MTLTFKDSDGVECVLRVVASDGSDERLDGRRATIDDLTRAGFVRLATGSDALTKSERRRTFQDAYLRACHEAKDPDRTYVSDCSDVGYQALFTAGAASRQPEVDRLTARVRELEGCIGDAHRKLANARGFEEGEPLPTFDTLLTELCEHRHQWRVQDGNTPGYSNEKAKLYGRKAAEWRQRAESAESKLAEVERGRDGWTRNWWAEVEKERACNLRNTEELHRADAELGQLRSELERAQSRIRELVREGDNLRALVSAARYYREQYNTGGRDSLGREMMFRALDALASAAPAADRTEARQKEKPDMHPRALAAIVADVRKRHDEGDCPTTPSQPTEALEFALLALASMNARGQRLPTHLLVSDDWLREKILADRDADTEAGSPLPLTEPPRAADRAEAAMWRYICRSCHAERHVESEIVADEWHCKLCGDGPVGAYCTRCGTHSDTAVTCKACEPPRSEAGEHDWLKALDGAYDSRDWRCVRCGEGRDGPEPSVDGCKGKPRAEAGESATVSLNVEMVRDPVCGQLRFVDVPPAESKPEPQPSGPLVIGGVTCGLHATIDMWAIVDERRAETIAYATSEAAAKRICNAPEPAASVPRSEVEAFVARARRHPGMLTGPMFAELVERHLLGMSSDEILERRKGAP